MRIDQHSEGSKNNLVHDMGFPPIDFGLFENVRICRDDDFKSLVESSVAGSDCEFLFEIPAIMIGENGKKAAALRFFMEEDPIYCFVLMCKNSGSIDLLQEHEVSESLSDFVHSYAEVLNMLAIPEKETAKVH